MLLFRLMFKFFNF
ncbi:hypothetical protein ECEC1737_5737, partial [Escherichia coli EC1737]